MQRSFKYTSLMLLLLGMCAVECAAKKKPEAPIDPKFTSITSMSVLPIVDVRVGEKHSVNLEKLQKNAANILKRKRYTAELAATPGSAGEIAEEDLKDAKPEYIKKLGPDDSRWVMVVCLADVASKMTFGSTGNAEVSGYLFDKETGENLWKGKGVGQAGQGGLAGMMMKGSMKTEALNAAIYNLFGSLPTLPKPEKKKKEKK